MNTCDCTGAATGGHDHRCPAAAPPEGQLCDRLRNYETHEAHSATRGPRGAKCPRPAKARDANGVWACAVHLGADKRGEQNRERGRARRTWKNSPARREYLNTELTEGTN